MTDKQLSKLRRTELLEMLIAQGNDYAKLQEKLKETEKALHTRQLTIEKAGSMAEAAFKLNDVVGSTQRAVDLYIENVRRVMTQQQEEATEAVNIARKYAIDTVTTAEKRARSLLVSASEQATQILLDARDEAERLVAQARENADKIRTDAQISKIELLEEARKTAATMPQAAAPEKKKKRFGFLRNDE